MNIRHLLKRGLRNALLSVGLSAALSATAAETLAAETLTVDADGTIHVDGLSVPVSDLLSPEARAIQAARLVQPPAPVLREDGVPTARIATDKFQKMIAQQWLARYPARIETVTMNGVRTDVVTPDAGIAPENQHRVLINLHGGGFFAGAVSGGLAEAVPVAGRGRIKVVTVDYRLAPENRFPAASEDVEHVYRALLTRYKPAEIGLYGCSAGGTLVAQSVAWFQSRHLPPPGAIGVFCSGAMPGFWYGGDSFATTQMMNARLQATDDDMRDGAGSLYLAGRNQDDPLVTPALFPQVLAKFPPTLLITSTRDSAMSNVLVTNARLLAAGVETQLFVQEGLGHGEFNYVVGSPEAAQAYDVIWRFFDKHLAR
ncbi:alpha/beta hydrolase fold domain-containing protein [Nitrospirillum sp. BR 11828]|uniref:alpha/beta hydrolase fold domain-containing protein n=1 Tax=Nitrospirillum sp. BR 11828 TaxID=3104325 RepID=UPI002ACA6C02|nr:alpha/beta hydrolase fold domain-containing protein [Nitrospirillum sp. BR 11828]MDZ5648498.1 alpha/beta hydrolase fold domain-containing protein [Nitrospirillum sp. BR 11828]